MIEEAENPQREAQEWPEPLPLYISKHVDCPKCGDPMRLYIGKWMCWCGHEEPCCE